MSCPPSRLRSLTAYALIKLLYKGHDEKRIMLLVNMVDTAEEAVQVYKNINRATEHFLGLNVEYLGLYPSGRKGRGGRPEAKTVHGNLPPDAGQPVHKRNSQETLFGHKLHLQQREYKIFLRCNVP